MTLGRELTVLNRLIYGSPRISDELEMKGNEREVPSPYTNTLIKDRDLSVEEQTIGADKAISRPSRRRRRTRDVLLLVSKLLVLIYLLYGMSLEIYGFVITDFYQS